MLLHEVRCAKSPSSHGIIVDEVYALQIPMRDSPLMEMRAAAAMRVKYSCIFSTGIRLG